MRLIRIIDVNTGEEILEQKISGDFQLQWTETTDSGNIHRRGRIENGKFDYKYWIKNYYYRPIAEKLIERFEELKHIRPESILFLENTEWEPSNSKKTWAARISKANTYLRETWGYNFLLETRGYFMDNMSEEQIIATIYHELMHIDKAYDIRSHDIEDWEHMVATLGTNWAETKSQIANLLDEEFPGWNFLRKSDNQINLFNMDKVASITRASKRVNSNE